MSERSVALQLAGRLFGESWHNALTEYKAPSGQTDLQYLLPWFYTCRLDVPFDAVPAALELCRQVQLTDLVDEANLALNSEGSAHCLAHVSLPCVLGLLSFACVLCLVFLSLSI